MNKLLLFTLLCALSIGISSQKATKDPPVYVDNKGIMRWSDTRKEASFYGVNYSIPFAHGYRAINYTCQDHKKAMDKDVYHFSRLGFNAYRIHVWDKEISDKEGNLIKNDHLDYFDYLIAKLKERNIKIVLTVMRMKDNGHPEADVWYGGFTDYWEKCIGHIDPEAITSQVNFTKQFIMHVNPYTGVSYMDDSDVIAFEIDNEPCHPGTAEQLRSYIQTLLGAYKQAGNKKPVFYNVTHNLQHVDSYYRTDIDGTTYQWYPTGLVAGFMRQGNFLPHADEYNITFRNVKNFDKKAKMVYEFDAPDFGGSYLYPSITRAFRSEGMQWITMFAYDAMDLAWANTEYVTHYLNLAYTPGKAVGMKIAAEVTRTMPLGKRYEPYPKDTVFESFRVSYNEDLSEMNTPNKFFYSNNTSTHPLNVSSLMEIAGCGSSPIVKYEGTGAYFIDQLENGVWRLEVMPDVLWTKDPFEKPSLRKEIATIMWNTWPMEINLPSLGSGFKYKGINSGNNAEGVASDKIINVSPGVYILTKSGFTPQNNWNADTKWNVINLGEYAAPEHRADKFSVVHKAHKFVTENTPFMISADIVGPALPDSVVIYTGRRHHRYPNNPRTLMTREKGLTYKATIPANQITNGTLYYTIVVYHNGEPRAFPADVSANPTDWDYYWHEYWETPVVSKESSIKLITVDKRNDDVEIHGIPDHNTQRVVRMPANVTELETPRIKITFDEYKATNRDYLNMQTDSARFFVRKFIKPDIDARSDMLNKITSICVQIMNPENIDRLKIGFVSNMGFTYTTPIILDKNTTVYRIPVSQLKQTTTALLPETYPVFLKRYFIPQTNVPFRVQDIEILEISTDEIKSKSSGFELGNVWLE